MAIILLANCLSSWANLPRSGKSYIRTMPGLSLQSAKRQRVRRPGRPLHSVGGPSGPNWLWGDGPQAGHRDAVCGSLLALTTTTLSGCGPPPLVQTSHCTTPLSCLHPLTCAQLCTFLSLPTNYKLTNHFTHSSSGLDSDPEGPEPDPAAPCQIFRWPGPVSAGRMHT